MKLNENGSLAEATIQELRALWMYHEFDELFPFDEFVSRLQKAGVVIQKNEIIKAACHKSTNNCTSEKCDTTAQIPTKKCDLS